MSNLQHHEHVFCVLMDALEACLQLRAQLDQTLKAGHLNITKARYAMGASSISPANYKSMMQAVTYLRKTQIQSTVDQPFTLACRLGATLQTSSESIQAADAFNRSLSNGDITSSTSGQQQPETPEATAQSCESSAEQSTAQTKQQTASSEYSSTAIADLAAKFDSTHVDDATSAQHCSTTVDPLKWFGYMVSPHLRQAQSCFTQAAETAVQLANTQHQIMTAMNEIAQLRTT